MQKTTNMATKKPRGPWHRISAPDFSTAEEVLKAAAVLMVPEDQTQRQALEKLMPTLYVLKNIGFSFPQLAGLLSQCGFNLQPSSVRDYFREMLATRMDICQERMNEQMLLMAEVRKETKGADMSAIFGRVSAVMDKQRSAAGSKINAMLGIAPKDNAGVAPGSGSGEFAGPATPARGNAVAELRPALEKQPPEPETARDEGEMGSFGLLSAGNANAHAGKPVFFSMDDDAPGIPDLTARPAPSGGKTATASPQDDPQHRNAAVSCHPLPSGIKPLQQRPSVPAAVYAPGDMEHPAVPGVMLSLDQRLCSVALEFVDKNGEIRLETSEEKRLRIFWLKPVSVTPTMTAGSFTKMDETLFSKKGG